MPKRPLRQKEDGMNDWISVNDRAPEKWDNYLCIVLRGASGRCVRYVRIVKNYPCNPEKWDIEDGLIVTHWIPIPELPLIWGVIK